MNSPHPPLITPRHAFAASLVLAATSVAIVLWLSITWPLSADALGMVAGYDLPRFFKFLGRFHPVVLHTPVGILGLVLALQSFALIPRLRGHLQALEPAITLGLWGAALGSIPAVVCGWFLGAEGGFAAAELIPHKNFALFILAGSVLLVVLRHLPAVTASVWPRRLQFVVLVATAASLAAGAHRGGSLTHGSEYLTEHAPAWLGGPQAAAKSSDPAVYAAVIAPILKARCNECHNDTKVKGKLKLNTLAGIMAGGESGDNVIPGKPEDSLLVKRSTLPVDDDDRMPPDKKPGLSADQLAVIRWWISAGAGEGLKVSDAAKAPEAAAALARLKK